MSTWAGHSDIRVTLNRYGHIIPGSEHQAAERLTAYLAGSTVAHTADSTEAPAVAGLDEYRYRDSNPSSSPTATAISSVSGVLLPLETATNRW